ncbi:hypothetical protein BD413DRAFT_519349 [Trametes elegans]|nr:hypothetical protein BD413DRAFT_519349 [Trametes elegans]
MALYINPFLCGATMCYLPCWHTSLASLTGVMNNLYLSMFCVQLSALRVSGI